MMAMRSDSVSASSWSWVTKIVVMPISRWISRSSTCISWRRRRSSAPSGSSSSSTFGRVTSARASATRCCWPPESCRGLRRRGRAAAPAPASPGRAARSPRARPAHPGRRRCCRSRSDGETAHSSGTPCRCPGDAPARFATRSPSKLMLPLSGSTKPAIARSSVVLPLPEGPSRPKNSPSAKWTLTSSSAFSGAVALARPDRHRPGSFSAPRRSCSSAPPAASGPWRPG